MTDQKMNALKHGAYSTAVLLPYEDPEEFKKLLADVTEEWDPQGLSQEDKVFSIALGYWRKRRVRRHLQAKIDELESTRKFKVRMRDKQSERTAQLVEDLESGALSPLNEENLESKLGDIWAKRIKQKVPRSNFTDDQTWLAEVGRFMFEFQLAQPPVLELEKALGDEDLIDRELTFEERIDGKIAKDIKELGQMKTLQAIGLGKRRVTAATPETPQVMHSPPLQVSQADTNR